MTDAAVEMIKAYVALETIYPGDLVVIDNGVVRKLRRSDGKLKDIEVAQTDRPFIIQDDKK